MAYRIEEIPITLSHFQCHSTGSLSNVIFRTAQQLYSIWQDFDWHNASRGSSTIGELLLVVWHSGRTSVCDRQTFSVLRSTCSWWV